jgi:hypothetical protein
MLLLGIIAVVASTAVSEDQSSDVSVIDAACQ